jgi:hypothetical protein
MMNRLLSYCSLAIIGISGCQTFSGSQKTAVAPPKMEIAAPVHVKADEITSGNAREKSRLLQQEIDQDQQRATR